MRNLETDSELLTASDGPVTEEEAEAAYRAAEEAAQEDAYRSSEEEAVREALEAEARENSTSCASIDLAGHVNGTVKIPEPAIWVRTDGRCLIYRGKTHYFIGESVPHPGDGISLKEPRRSAEDSF